MKRFFLLFLLSLALITGCTAQAVQDTQAVQTSNAVTLPDALKLAIAAVILGAVMSGLQVVFEHFGLDLRGAGAAIAAGVSGFVIAQLQGLVNGLPFTYDPLVLVVLNVLVVILGGIGTIRLIGNPGRAHEVIASRRPLRG